MERYKAKSEKKKQQSQCHLQTYSLNFGEIFIHPKILPSAHEVFAKHKKISFAHNDTKAFC